jgi:hypothetical protein
MIFLCFSFFRYCYVFPHSVNTGIKTVQIGKGEFTAVSVIIEFWAEILFREQFLCKCLQEQTLSKIPTLIEHI